jgi:hypothetical protein
MSQTNLLQKYFRQPKIYMTLPSKGLYYPPGQLKGDYTNVPIFGMTGMDEILFKTPDALFNGEASSKVIESCCPTVSNARKMPNLDVDAVLIAVRIATYGETMSIGHTCGNCDAENEFDIDLKPIVEYFSDLTFENTVPIGEITVRLRPLDYDEMTQFSVENFKLQRMLYQTSDIPQAQQQEHLDKIYQSLAEIQVNLFMLSIESVLTPEGLVEDKDMIREWLQNSEKSVYAEIKTQLEKNKETWSIPKQNVKCGNCGTEDRVEITLDQSSFFG